MWKYFHHNPRKKKAIELNNNKKKKNYSKLGASSVGLDSKTSELDASGSSRRSLDLTDSLYAGVSLKSVAPTL